MKRLIGILIMVMIVGALSGQGSNTFKYVLKTKGGIINTLKGLSADKVDSTKVSGGNITHYQGGDTLNPTVPYANQVNVSAVAVLKADSTGNAAGNYMTRQNYHNDPLESSALKNAKGFGCTLKVGPILGYTAYSGTAMGDGNVHYSLFYIPEKTTITGVAWFQTTQGNYTADNNNKVGLYSISGATYTKVAESADDGNMWKAAASTIATKNFSSAYSAEPGYYMVAAVYNSSAQTTAPSIAMYGSPINKFYQYGFTDGRYLAGRSGAQADLPATQAAAGLSEGAVYYMAIFLY